MLIDTYRALTLVSGSLFTATVATPPEALKTLELIDQYGVRGVLLVLTGFFWKLWRDSNKARLEAKDERILKLESELSIERARKSPSDKS